MTSSIGKSRVGPRGYYTRVERWTLRCGRVMATSLIVTGFLAGTASADVLYVSAEALPGGDGQTWSTAHRFLQDALAAAAPGSGVTEIRVAQGVYQPDRSEAAPDGTGDRHATFTLISGVALRGGYAGPGFTDPDARDWDVYETILSGDLAGDDGPDFESYGENSYTVVMASAVDATAVLEGFNIEGGNANGIPASQSTLHRQYGGAMFSAGGSPTVRHCFFHKNKAIAGGAVALRNGAQPLVEWCTFTGNQSEVGGALHCWNGSAAVIAHCNFSLNVSESRGGAIRTFQSDITIRDSVFEQNQALKEGGAIKFENGNVTVERCSFLGNFAEGPGGAINTGGSGQNPVSGACFFIVDSEFDGNESAAAAGAALLLSYCDSSSITRCTFTEHSASVMGGALIATAAAGSAIRFLDCAITHNTITGTWGSAIVVVGDIAMTNCLIAKNHSSTGAPAVSYSPNEGSSMGPMFINSTIAHNVGPGMSPLDEETFSHVTIHNSIIWGNTDGQIKPNALALVFNSNVQGGWSGLGSDNINADPLFVQPGMGDFRLSEGSPCIDIGDNSALPPDVTTDLAGNPRILNGIVDLGAYEGEFEQMPAATMATNIKPGQMVFLLPTGSDGLDVPTVLFTNLSNKTAEHVIVTQYNEDMHPTAVGYSALASTLELETTLDDGEFRASLFLPFTAAQLGEHPLEDVRISLHSSASNKWELAVAQNITGQAADKPIVQIGPFFTAFNLTMGAYGVFWNPDEQAGLAWANVDRIGDFAVGIDLCPADLTGNGKVSIFDLLMLVIAMDTHDPGADLNGDGIVDTEDLLLLIAAWGPCP